MGDYEDRIGSVGGSSAGSGQLFNDGDVPSRADQAAHELTQWLEALEENGIPETVRKAVQYGSSDLRVMGEALALLLPKERRSAHIGMQMAVGFYALGKVSRLFGAFEQGTLPTADDWFDLKVYATMGLRILETGDWFNA